MQPKSISKAGVGVDDDELHARPTALVELGEQVAPGRLRLLGADGDCQKLSVAVEADARLPLRWVPVRERFDFWKTEVKRHLVAPGGHDVSA